MDLNKLENIRKKYVPFYLSFIFIIFAIILASVILLIFPILNLVWWKFLIIVICDILIISLLIYLMFLMEKLYIKEVSPIYNEIILSPILEKNSNYKVSFNLKEKINTRLFRKKQKYNVLLKVESMDFNFYEVSILKDIIFHGVVFEINVDNPKNFEYIIKNYRYFTKLDLKKKTNVKTNNKNFDNRFLLFDVNKKNNLDPKLMEKIYLFTSVYKSVGVELVGNKLYILLKTKDNFFMPSITQKIDLNLLPILDNKIKIMNKLVDLKRHI